MKLICGNTVELTDAEMDAVAYFEELLSEGKGITVAAYWALRSATHLGQRITTEFALWLSEDTLALGEHRMPVINRFSEHGEEQVQEWLDADPTIAAVYGTHLSIAAFMADEEEASDAVLEAAVSSREPVAQFAATLDLDEPVTRRLVPVPAMRKVDDQPAAYRNPEPVFPA